MAGAEGLAASFFEASPGALQQALLERMQKVQGNRVVARIVQRQPLTPAPAAGTAPPVPADLQTFRDRGAMPAAAAGTTVTPAGGFGGFQARYDPVGMVLTITMNVGITFVDGMSLSGGRAVGGDPGGSLNNAAAQVNALPRAARAAEVAKWQWGGDRETWMAGYRGNVTGAWATAGTGLQFQSSHAGWEAQLSRVNVVVNTQDVAAAGPVAPGASTIPATAGPIHCQATIYKTPTDNSDFGAAVGGRNAAGVGTLSMGSGQTVAHGHLLHQAIQFPRVRKPGDVALSAAQKSRLDNIIFSFQTPAGGAGTSITITGHADTSGGGTPEGDARNQAISERRAQVVGDYLKATRVGGQNLVNAATRISVTAGVYNVENFLAGIGVGAAPTGANSRRVDINFAGGAGQNTAAHEFGHMLGLDDQYAVDPAGVQGVVGGTGGAVGTPTGDDPRTIAAGLGRSTYENNDNLMSLGSTIRAPHYLTFMEALRSVTGSAEWRMKA